MTRADDLYQEGDRQKTDQPVTRTPPPNMSGDLGLLREALYSFSDKFFKKMKHEFEMRDSLHQTSDAIVAGLRLYR